MTRYARALRDVALASGERPARRGYPASVFDNLPRLLRGATSEEETLLPFIRYFLLESEEEADDGGDEIRSIMTVTCI